MSDQVANAVKVTVSGTYTADATEITLAAGQGAELPDPAGDNYNLPWWDSTNYGSAADDPKLEIVRITAKTGDVIAVTRAQESTVASTKNTAGATYKMIMGVTAKTITDLVAETTAVNSALTTHESDTSTHGVDEVADAATVTAEIDSDILTHKNNGDAHHAEAHSVVSHNDTTATGAELEDLTDGSDADLLHAHGANDTHRTSNGSDHSYLDQSVVSGAAPALLGTNITEIPAADHNDLGSIQGGSVDDYYHLTTAQLTDLTDSGASAAHYHTVDRARVNHTGTQASSTVTMLATARILGRKTAEAGAVEELTKADVLTLINVTEAADVTADNAPQTHAMSTHTDEGDLATKNTVGTTEIDDDAVTYAKLQNISETARLIGRKTAGAGNAEEMTAAEVLSMISVESGADVTDATNVDAAGAAMNNDKNVANGIPGLTASSRISPAQMAPYLHRNSNICQITDSSDVGKELTIRSTTYVNTGADGDKYFLEFFCDGTETKLHLGTQKGPNRGIFDLYVNGVQDSTGYDEYNGSMVDNTLHITLTESIVLGYNIIELRINGKNGSSSDYYIVAYNGILQ